MQLAIQDKKARWAMAGAIGLVLAAGLGLIAGLTRDNFWLSFTVFTVVMAPALVALSAMVLGEGQGSEPAYAEDTIETHWARVAGLGAFLDLVIAMGLSVAAASILHLPSIPLVFFLLLAMSDFAMRLWRLSRQGGQ
ncbi:hypothetical protein K0651_12720 [Ornithinimicrobium sp. Arc0846-15]|nr:hypothetical protein [Ornithinimicrobium laminariae]